MSIGQSSWGFQKTLQVFLIPVGSRQSYVSRLFLTLNDFPPPYSP